MRFTKGDFQNTDGGVDARVLVAERAVHETQRQKNTEAENTETEIQSAPITSREKEKVAGFNGLIQCPESLVSQQTEEPFGCLQTLMTPLVTITHIPWLSSATVWTFPHILERDPYIKIDILDLLTIPGTSFHWSLSVDGIVFCLQLYV